MIDFNASGAINQAVGIVGAVIMPHNLYLHSALATSRNINRKSDRQISQANKYNAIESGIALFVSFLINVFVVTVFAEAFYGTPNASDVDLQSSGKYLAEHFGSAVKYIWAIGLLAAGQSSTMTGTYAGQFVMEGFLRLHMAPWKRVAITRSLAMVPTLVIAVVTNKETLNTMFEWMNILQSFQLPFALFPLLHFVALKGVMGKRRLKGWTLIAVWVMCLFLFGVNSYLMIDTFVPFFTTWYYTTLVMLIVVPYIGFTIYVIAGPLLSFGGMAHFKHLHLDPIHAYLHDDEEEMLVPGYISDGEDDPLLNSIDGTPNSGGSNDDLMRD